MESRLRCVKTWRMITSQTEPTNNQETGPIGFQLINFLLFFSFFYTWVIFKLFSEKRKQVDVIISELKIAIFIITYFFKKKSFKKDPNMKNEKKLPNNKKIS